MGKMNWRIRMFICKISGIIEGDSVKVVDCKEDILVKKIFLKKVWTGNPGYVLHCSSETSLK